MDSTFLLKNAFQKFGEFDYNNIKNGEAQLNDTGVYAFVLNTTFPRLCGTTDILYIGHAGSRSKRPIYKRMIDYCKAYESAPQDKRISDSINKIKTKVRIGSALRSKSLDNKVILYYKIVEYSKCREEESNLLKKYTEDHIELPPLNRSN